MKFYSNNWKVVKGHNVQASCMLGNDSINIANTNKSNKYFANYLFSFVLFTLFLASGYSVKSQCLTNSLIINTGYDPITASAIAPGTNGGTPVIDPHWIVTAESPGVATAIAATPLPGILEVTPGNNADVVPIVGPGLWAVNPGADPGGWISCLNSNYYYDCLCGTPYNMTLGRPFRMCADDSITFTLYIANDNYISSTDIDGVVLPFSQPASAVFSNFETYSYFTQTVFLTAGTHTLHFVINNYNEVAGDAPSNPTGLDVYGTVSSATATNSLVSESSASCATYICDVSCNSVNLPDSIKICRGDTVTLPAVMVGTDSVLSYTWTPATGLSSTTILNPILTATTSGWYYIDLQSLNPNNLVVNGNFSLGNVGFTSSYTYVSSGAGELLPESVYAIVTNPFGPHPDACSFGDHTTGTGNMMAINGASTPISVWCETIPVLPNTNYNFSAWVANWSAADVGTGVPDLQFMINGTLIGTADAITSACGVWVNFFATWNSGINTTANICIYDETTAADGNDFALDDISFNQICSVTDSVYVLVNIPDTTSTHSDTTVCANIGSITLTAASGYLSYLWSTGSTGGSIVVSTAGSYWVYDSSVCAILVDTFDVNFKALPVISLGNDTGFCQGDSLVLTSIQPSGDTLLWSTGSSGDSIHVTTSGTYSLTVSNGCVYSASITVTVSPTPLVNLGPDTSDCSGTPIVLQSSYTYTGATYLWSNTTTGATTTVTATGTYWLQVTVGGCSGSDTINVTILYDTFHLYTPDTAICKGRSVQVLATGNTAAQTYQWEPTAGIPNSTTITPIITPDTSATYAVFVFYPGCPTFVDSFHIDVQPVPIVYLGGNRSVCDHDTLHITASVTPQWYSGYIYSWSPSTDLDNTTMSTVVFTAGDTSELTLTVNTPAGCIGIDSAQIIVHTDSFVHYDTSLNLCPGDSVQLQPQSDDPGTTYIWHPAMYMTDTNSSTPWVFPLTTQLYWAVATSSYGCHDTVTANILVLPEAVLNLGDSVTLYPGQTYQLNPQTNCSSFLWFPPSGLSNAYISNPVADPVVSTKYLVYGTTEWGCKAVDSINIFVDPNSLLALPNAFTPGNGPNSLFKIIVNGEASLNYFHVYNRWGNLVYSSSDINAGWDGTYNGVPQPFDVYVYEIEAVNSNGKVFHKTGNVTLVR